MDLFGAAIVAALIMRAFENSRRRSRAAWDEARSQAAHHRAQRDKARQERRKARGKRLREAADEGPGDPLWWPLAAGWLAVAAGKAAHAGVSGAREALRDERIRKEARQRAYERARRRGERREPGQTPPPGPDTDAVTVEGCTLCGVYVPAAELDEHGQCRVCAEHRQQPRPDGDPDGDPDRHHPPPDGAGHPAGDGEEERMVPCVGCGAYAAAAELNEHARCRVCAHPHRGGGGLYFGANPARPNGQDQCPACEGRAAVGDPPGPCPACRARQQARNADHHERHGWADGAMRWTPDGRGDRIEIPGRPAGNREETQLEGSAPVSTNLEFANGIGYGTGEGYRDTVSTLNTLARQLQTAHETARTLSENLTANEADGQTISNVSELMDALDAAAPMAAQTARHVQTRHEPVAEAVAGAGGSQHVATKGWYDDH